jgi:predicted enzyme related to lactoylglutathione lyase
VEFDRYEDGVPSWVDLGSTDLAKSRDFYAGLFGWNCPEGPPEAGGYSVCDLGGKTVAGLGPLMNPNMPPVWMTYVNVDSADDAVTKVAANGGTVFMPPMDVMDAGRMAVFADPVGAVIGLWQPNQHTGAQVANEPNTYRRSARVYRVAVGGEVHRRHDAEVAANARGDATGLGGLFRGGRHRCHGEEGPRARCQRVHGTGRH